MNNSLSTYKGKEYRLISLSKKSKEFQIRSLDFNISEYNPFWAVSSSFKYYYIVYINRK